MFVFVFGIHSIYPFISARRAGVVQFEISSPLQPGSQPLIYTIDLLHSGLITLHTPYPGTGGGAGAGAGETSLAPFPESYGDLSALNPNASSTHISRPIPKSKIVSLTLSSKDLLSIAVGERLPIQMWDQGRLSIKGDVEKAVGLGKLLSLTRGQVYAEAGAGALALAREGAGREREIMRNRQRQRQVVMKEEGGIGSYAPPRMRREETDIFDIDIEANANADPEWLTIGDSEGQGQSGGNTIPNLDGDEYEFEGSSDGLPVPAREGGSENESESEGKGEGEGEGRLGVGSGSGGAQVGSAVKSARGVSVRAKL